jgi:hypothetical protein
MHDGGRQNKRWLFLAIVVLFGIAPIGPAKAEAASALSVLTVSGEPRETLEIRVPRGKTAGSLKIQVVNESEERVTGRLVLELSDGLTGKVDVDESSRNAVDLEPDTRVLAELSVADVPAEKNASGTLFLARKSGPTDVVASVTIAAENGLTIAIEQADEKSAISGTSPAHALALPLSFNTNSETTVAVNGFLRDPVNGSSLPVRLDEITKDAVQLPQGRSEHVLVGELPYGGDYTGKLTLTDPEKTDYVFTLSIKRTRAAAPVTVGAVDARRVTLPFGVFDLFGRPEKATVTYNVRVQEAEGVGRSVDLPVLGSVIRDSDEGLDPSDFDIGVVDLEGKALSKIELTGFGPANVLVRVSGPFEPGGYTFRFDFPQGEAIAGVTTAATVKARFSSWVAVLLILGGLLAGIGIRWLGRKLTSARGGLRLVTLDRSLAELNARLDLSATGRRLVLSMGIQRRQLAGDDDAKVMAYANRLNLAARWLALEPVARSGPSWALLQARFAKVATEVATDPLPDRTKEALDALEADTSIVVAGTIDLLKLLADDAIVGTPLRAKVDAIGDSVDSLELDATAREVATALSTDLATKLQAINTIPGVAGPTWQAKRTQLVERLAATSASGAEALRSFRDVACDYVTEVASGVYTAAHSQSETPQNKNDRGAAMKAASGAMASGRKRDLAAAKTELDVALAAWAKVAPQALGADEPPPDTVAATAYEILLPPGPIPGAVGTLPSSSALKRQILLAELVLFLASLAVALGLGLAQLYASSNDWGDLTQRTTMFLWALGINLAGGSVFDFKGLSALGARLMGAQPVAS